ncbi:TPA: hypothetical protein ACGUTO_000014 [Vibrio vulnificus]|nr:hypothetical protein [Vibrio vulnificus]
MMSEKDEICDEESAQRNLFNTYYGSGYNEAILKIVFEQGNEITLDLKIKDEYDRAKKLLEAFYKGNTGTYGWRRNNSSNSLRVIDLTKVIFMCVEQDKG